MTQEEKSILLQELCARLPYRTFVQTYRCNTGSFELLMPRLLETFIKDEGLGIKPYLRPMSSMTEEERVTYSIYHDNPQNIGYGLIDWLNAHHFDYRRLIEKGLALEAPEDMYN